MLTENGFILVWTGSATESLQVVVQQDEGDWQQEIDVQAVNGRYEAAITGLQQGTFCRYEIRSADKGVLAEGRTRTAPKQGDSFRFLAFGDSGSGDENQYKLAGQMPKYDPDLVIHAGDIIHSKGAAEDYPEKFFKPYAELLKRAAFYPCIGNHDWDDYQGQPLFDVFTLPANGPQQATPERHYWFDFGEARFVAFDSCAGYTEIRDEVAPWLNDVLADAGDRWKIVYFHHPAYTAGKYDPSGKIRNLITPLFDRHRVHLTFSGHNHMYERSHPINNGTVVEPGQGTVYLVTGTGAAHSMKRKNPSLIHRRSGSATGLALLWLM